jgi:DNA-binding response OmpR family regulator
LQGRGHLVRTAAGVEAALGAARAERPDLLLVDARLPRRHELITALRQEAGLEGLTLALVR